MVRDRLKGRVGGANTSGGTDTDGQPDDEQKRVLDRAADAAEVDEPVPSSLRPVEDGAQGPAKMASGAGRDADRPIEAAANPSTATDMAMGSPTESGQLTSGVSSTKAAAAARTGNRVSELAQANGRATGVSQSPTASGELTDDAMGSDTTGGEPAATGMARGGSRFADRVGGTPTESGELSDTDAKTTTDDATDATGATTGGVDAGGDDLDGFNGDQTDDPWNLDTLEQRYGVNLSRDDVITGPDGGLRFDKPTQKRIAAARFEDEIGVDVDLDKTDVVLTGDGRARLDDQARDRVEVIVEQRREMFNRAVEFPAGSTPYLTDEKARLLDAALVGRGEMPGWRFTPNVPARGEAAITPSLTDEQAATVATALENKQRTDPRDVPEERIESLEEEVRERRENQLIVTEAQAERVRSLIPNLRTYRRRRARAATLSKLDDRVDEQAGTNLKRGADYTVSYAGDRVVAVLTKQGRRKADIDPAPARTRPSSTREGEFLDHLFGNVDETAQAAVSTGAEVATDVGETVFNTVTGNPKKSAAVATVAATEPTPIGEAIVGGVVVAGTLVSLAPDRQPVQQATEITVPSEGLAYSTPDVSIAEDSSRFDSEIEVDEGTGDRRRLVQVPDDMDATQGEIDVPTSMDRSEITVGEDMVSVPTGATLEIRAAEAKQKQQEDDEADSEDETGDEEEDEEGEDEDEEEEERVVVEVPSEMVPEEEVVIGGEQPPEDSTTREQPQLVEQDTDAEVDEDAESDDGFVEEDIESGPFASDAFVDPGEPVLEVPDPEIGIPGPDEGVIVGGLDSRQDGDSQSVDVGAGPDGVGVGGFGLDEDSSSDVLSVGVGVGVGADTFSGTAAQAGLLNRSFVSGLTGLSLATATATDIDLAAVSVTGYGTLPGLATDSMGLVQQQVTTTEVTQEEQQQEETTVPATDYGLGLGRGRGRDDEDDDDGNRGGSRALDLVVGGGDSPRAPGYLAETVTDYALGVSIEGRELADDADEFQPFGEFETEALAEGGPQIAATLDIFGFGGDR